MGFFKGRASAGERLVKILGDVEVPSFPQVTMRILERLRDPDTDAVEVADAMQWDSALVVRVLSTVNSAAFGPAQVIEDLRHAIALMGRTQLEQVVLAVAVKGALPSDPAPGFEAARFWHTAALRASLSRAIAVKLHPARQSESFIVGLLQDMAIPVLANARPEDYGPVLESWHATPGTDLATLETEAFGWCHAEIGALLGAGWQLPEALIDSIQNHHDLRRSDAELLPAIRLVATWRETHAEHGIEALVEEARSQYGLGPDWMRESLANCTQQAQELADTLG